MSMGRASSLTSGQSKGQDAQAVVDIVALRAVPKDEFDRVWSVYSYFQEAEFHLNELQSRYRTLASTWLLATFGGAGFIVSDPSLALPIDSVLLASVVCVLGAIGITLLWNLDVMVYQGLFRSRFNIGRRMEEDVSWLPPVRRRISATYPSGATPRVATFYVAAIAAPLVFGAALFGLWVNAVRPELIIPVLLVWLVAILTVSRYVASASRSPREAPHAVPVGKE